MIQSRNVERVNKMEDILNVILMCLSAVIIILVLLQSGKSDGLSAAFTGSGDLNLFAVTKERGPEKFISRMTLACGIVFFALVIALQIV